jgi:hypothetical protein
VQRLNLQEIRERTYKDRDAWWTVLLVDPFAARLVRLVAPYRWITPNLLSFVAFLFGIGSAACFLAAERWWLVAGAVLFHLSFVVDCMDGKIARLNGTGSMFGAWFDFIFDRIRVVICTIALMGGQYERTGQIRFLWLALAVITLDLFRYLDGSQVAKIKRAMSRQLSEARGEDLPPASTAIAMHDTENEEEDDDEARDVRNLSPYLRFRNRLLRHRIRVHLFSGIEYEMTVFIIGPLIGFVFWTSIVAGALLMLFEAALVFRLYQLTRRFKADLARAQEEGDARRAGLNGVTPEATPTRV